MQKAKAREETEEKTKKGMDGRSPDKAGVAMGSTADTDVAPSPNRCTSPRNAKENTTNGESMH
eukprot:5144110-Ditylum_brightwellii.AAC.1